MYETYIFKMPKVLKFAINSLFDKTFIMIPILIRFFLTLKTYKLIVHEYFS